MSIQKDLFTFVDKLITKRPETTQTRIEWETLLMLKTAIEAGFLGPRASIVEFVSEAVREKLSRIKTK